jgi:hypothetical protein
MVATSAMNELLQRGQITRDVDGYAVQTPDGQLTLSATSDAQIADAFEWLSSSASKFEDLLNLYYQNILYIRTTQLPELFISFAVIRHFLGVGYLETHFALDAPDTGFFKLTPDLANNKEAARNYRIVDLAELLFNLQDINGFVQCISRMKDAANPEPSYAELHAARMLYCNDWTFRFVSPTGVKGADYDFEINYYNIRVCADAKYKIEATELSANTVTKTLAGSRQQLPADKPGVFFVKIPQNWIETPQGQEITIRGVEDFFAQGSGRVASVSLYCEALYFSNGILNQRQGFHEIANPRRRFGKDRDWNFFKKWKAPAGAADAMPPKWIRFANFPKSIKR